MVQEQKIRVLINGTERYVERGLKISDLLDIELLCAGNGRCGKCKVFARGELSALSDAEKQLLSVEEIKSGIRLSCSAKMLGACEIATVASVSSSANILTDASTQNFAVSPDFASFGIALDIGSTTLAAQLYDASGALLSSVAMLNPQSRCGADVISRIEYSLKNGPELLAELIREAINALICELCRKASVDSQKIEQTVITGNTAMLYLLTSSSPLSLSRAPFEADRLFGEKLYARELGLSSLSETSEVYLPHCISAFVGADTVCALLSSQICNAADTAILLDVGTNGEMALKSGDALLVCSTAAGPAFEGVGISCGMRGETGAIDKVALVNGNLEPHVIGATSARGICGSGLVDAVASMLDLEYLDETGLLEDGDVQICEGITITQADIRNVQLAKSAICAGVITLAKSASVSLTSIDRALIAGGFGSYLNMHSAARIGLIPKELERKASSIGNAALAGAAAILLNSASRAESERIAKSATVVELASNPIFVDAYINGMMFE